jgi:hypothetical protein
LEQDGEVIVTDHGRPIAILKQFVERQTTRPSSIDYYARLRRRMPKPIAKAARRALDEADRAER